MREFWNAFSLQLRPRFHEVSAYSIAFACCWILVFHPEFRDGALLFFSGFHSMSPMFVGLGLLVAAGLCLSLVHAFTDRRKSALEKAVMGWFIMAASGTAAFFVGIGMLPSRSSIALTLAIWNILTSLLLLAQMGTQKYDVADENASLPVVAFATVILVALLLFVDLYLHLSWSLVLSICIFYSTTVVFVGSWIADHFHIQVTGIPK